MPTCGALLPLQLDDALADAPAESRLHARRSGVCEQLVEHCDVVPSRRHLRAEERPLRLRFDLSALHEL